ncbi:MAG: hypothetical protein ACJA06_001220 [Halocynthiibacter sp.]|jgi:hypothetical protein
MNTYEVSFRIAEVGNYGERYTSVVDAVRREAVGESTWEEMTSSVVFKSSKSAESIANSICTGSKFDATKDRLFVVKASICKFATRGKIEDPTLLASMFPQNALASHSPQNALASLSPRNALAGL